MNNEEIKAMIKDCVYSEDGITYMSDKQYNNYINIIEQLQQENQSLEKENKILRENAEHNDKVVDKVNWENQKLKYNWNKFRETLKNEQLGSILYSDKKRFADIDEILLKMQELEKGDVNE